jgi:hypothetical protein
MIKIALSMILSSLLVSIIAACQVSHPAKVMYNPTTGDRVIVSHHGTTGKLGSAIAARYATETDIEALKKQGYQEDIKH